MDSSRPQSQSLGRYLGWLEQARPSHLCHWHRRKDVRKAIRIRYGFCSLFLRLALTILLDTSELGTTPCSSSYALRSALSLRPIVFCLPYVSSRSRLKRYEDRVRFIESIISTHFHRDRPRCRELYRALQREQYHQGSPQIRPETCGACFAVYRNPQTSSTRQRTRLEAQKASRLHPREQFVPLTLYIVVRLGHINLSTVESGVIIEAESLLVDPHDTPYARLFVRTHSTLRLFRLCN